MTKKGWATLAAAILGGIGTLLYIIVLIKGLSMDTEFARDAAPVLGFLFLTLGITVYLILSILKMEKIAKYVIAVAGVLSTIFIAVYFFYTLGYIDDIPDIGSYRSDYIWTIVIRALADLVLVGIIPLVYGVHKIIGKKEGK
jgi:hypothetical protein